MAFIVNFAKGVRNHWKKSTCAALALVYGINYAVEFKEIQDLMRVYCEKAAVYGKRTIPTGTLPKTVTVVLNPNANRRKAMRNFDKYCAPILNLAGICVDVVQTDSEGHAKTLMASLGPTDAIVVAGGDGTLSEVITGILRRTEENRGNLLPIGILPLGKHNTFAKTLFPGGKSIEDVRSLADASLAVVEEFTKPVDVMRIEAVNESVDNEVKPVYAVSGIEWGAYRDAQVKKESYWYFGSLKKYMTYLFNGYKDNLNWKCEATVKYTLPCEGCTNCHIENKVNNRRWYHKFLSNKSDKSKNISVISNEKCKETHETEISTSDLTLLTTNNISGSDGPPKLRLQLGPESVDYFDFVSQGWQSEQGRSRKIVSCIEARQLEIKPSVRSEEEKESWFSIDKEDFEVKAIRVTLLPKLINMYCKKSDTLTA